MFDKDFDQFASLLDGAISLNPAWKPIPAAGKALFFRALSPYSLEQVSAAMTAHIRDPKTGMFQPTPAHLIAHIQAVNGVSRPGADEAWAIAIKARDEQATVVWTTEIGEAFAACTPVLDIGDDVGARMAFKDAYTRLVDEAKRKGDAPRWVASLGLHVASRQAVLQQAVQAGLLEAPAVTHLLPPPEKPISGGNEFARKKLAELLAGLKSSQEKAEEAAEARKQEAREALARRKAELAEKADAYLRSKGDGLAA